MSASQNKKKTLSLGLALIPVISMLLLLIIGYGIMGLRIEPLLLCSAAVAAGIAWWQGYCWEDIINSVVDKLAKAMPVIMILICVGGLIGTWMFSGTIPYMVYWGLKLISPEYLLPWTSAGVYMATTLGVSTLDLLPWAIQCYAAIFFALIYGFSGIGIARTASASEKSPQSSVTE
ncbi:hypothetical protein JHS36_001160 [Salmonella enterica]|nr:hypothetical protein [Salmonella enterica]